MISSCSPLDPMVVAGCGLLLTRTDVSAVHVVSGRRPTYAELVRFRALVDACNLELVVPGSGRISMRSRHTDRNATPNGKPRAKAAAFVAVGPVSATVASRVRTSSRELK